MSFACTIGADIDRTLAARSILQASQSDWKSAF
jgi:hypothetical protein